MPEAFTDLELIRRLKLLEKYNNNAVLAAKAAGISSSTMRNSRTVARSRGLTTESVPVKVADQEIIPEPKINPLTAKIRERLKRSPCDLGELQKLCGLGENGVRGLLTDMQAEGFNVHQFGDKWQITHTPLPAAPAEDSNFHTLISRPDNTFLVGASSDQHLCSRYHRADVLNDLYDRFAKAKVQCVYNAGNWIDGEARFNKHELLVHGMEEQCRYLARHYPKRDGIVTYAVAGDDHEGWYGQREGVDIGRFAERIFHEEGREDWVHIGFMESYIKLQNYNTGKTSMMLICHPGGGSSYALSYSIQKLIEVLDGGEKPAVAFYGHYHKLWAGNIRNCWALQCGTCKDQDPFMRKKKIDAHVGGAIVKMEQDPETGAIIAFEPNMIRYFVKSYYQNRWSYSGDVTLPDRQP